MFPLYNPRNDYMQAFAAAKRKTNGQCEEPEDCEMALDAVDAMYNALVDLEDSPQCNWGLFSDQELATLYAKAKQFEIIMTDDPTTQRYETLVRRYLPDFEAPGTFGKQAQAECRANVRQSKLFINSLRWDLRRALDGVDVALTKPQLLFVEALGCCNLTA